MKYKSLKIDMDYCADPIWVSTLEDNPVFANGSLVEFEGILSVVNNKAIDNHKTTCFSIHQNIFTLVR